MAHASVLRAYWAARRTAASSTTRCASRIAAATPPDRDRVVDLVRAASLLVVVAGHWLMADVAVTGGQVTTSNALTALPGLHAATWVLQVMPLFFVAGGFANWTVWERVRARGGGYGEYLHGRTVRLLRPVLVFVLLAQGALGAAWAAGVASADVAEVARLLGRPLWFLVVYLLVTAAAPAMVRWHVRTPVAAVVVPAVGAVGTDALRVVAGVHGPAYVNFALVWLVAQQLGFWYADGRRTSLSPRALLAGAAAVVVSLLALTVAGPYPVSMIGLPGEEISNMNPPSVCLMLLAVGQAMLLALAQPRLARWLGRPTAWAGVVVVGARAMHLYLWHLVALASVVGLVLVLGASVPAAATPSWWLTRPVWLATLVAILAALVVPAGGLERFLAGRRSDHSAPTPRTIAVVSGVLLAVAGLFGFATSGLEPFGVTGELVLGTPTNVWPSSLLLLAGWLLAAGVPSWWRILPVRDGNLASRHVS